MDSNTFIQWSCKERENFLFQFGNNDERRWYQRDIDQITHSTPFRKLQRKSQLLSEKDPRSRSRLIHTIEVSRIATEISEKLGLSRELTEAISMGHDIATSPYGYVGNQLLSKYAPGFSHEHAGAYMLESLAKKASNNERSVIMNIIKNGWNEKIPEFDNYCINIADFPYKLRCSRNYNTSKKIRKNPQSNYYYISPEILDGVYCHGGGKTPSTLEGQVLQYSDNIAYLSQDIDDLIFTGILDPDDFTQLAVMSKAEFRDINGNRVSCGLSWDEMEDCFSGANLKDVFSVSRGKRIATFIRRYINYNLNLLQDSKLNMSYSSILNKEIPLLQCDPGLDSVINFMWKYTEKYYHDPLIKTSNEIQRVKMQQLWEIIQDPRLTTNNKCYNKFLEVLDNDSRFDHFPQEWKRAYFISYLSWQEVDLIIGSYHERDFSFELDVLELEDFPYENS